MEDSIQENTKFLPDEGKKERFNRKTQIMSEILGPSLTATGSSVENAWKLLRHCM